MLLHVPKTGGTWAHAAVCARVNRAHRQGGAHDTARRHAEHVNRLRSFGTTRNPFAWYASWWRHVMSLGPAYQQRLAVVGGGSLAFRDVLYGATHGRAPHPRPGVLAEGDGEEFAASGVGLCTWFHRDIYGDGEGGWLVDGLIDQGRLAEGLAEVYGVSFHDIKPRNVGDLRVDTPPKPEWDNEMLAWVSDADAGLIDLVGWVAPFSPAPQAVTYLYRGAP